MSGTRLGSGRPLIRNSYRVGIDVIIAVLGRMIIEAALENGG